MAPASPSANMIITGTSHLWRRRRRRQRRGDRGHVRIIGRPRGNDFWLQSWDSRPPFDPIVSRDRDQGTTGTLGTSLRSPVEFFR
jgi:hypothetical protein